MPEVPALQRIADECIRAWFGVSPERFAFAELVYFLFAFLAAALVLVFALHFAGIVVLVERRIAGKMQSRCGPNRVGPNGFLQWVVDGVKCIFKEDLVPDSADRFLFRIAPYFVVLGIIAAFAALPFSSSLIATDIDIGILFILGVTSLVVIGILLSGWGSNSKWALLGGMRSAAQIISYEIPAALAAMTVVILGGSLSTQSLVRAQGGAPWEWAIFASPFTFVAFFVFFIAQLAEGNRTPFDLPEAESELVSGYNTEYSGMRFALFFLGEFANIWVMCAVAVVLFLGGWQIPWGLESDGTPSAWLSNSAHVILAVLLVGATALPGFIAVQLVRYRKNARAAIARADIPGAAPKLVRKSLSIALDVFALANAGAVVGFVALAIASATGALGQAVGASLGAATWTGFATTLVANGLELGIFFAKTLVLVFVVIQLRWTLPRVRVDQMMSLCWKYLVPIGFACVIGTLVWELVVEATSPILGLAMRGVMFLAGAAVLLHYVRRVRANYLADKLNHERYRDTNAFHPPWRLV